MIALFEGKIGNGLIGRGLATEVSGYGPSYGKYTAPTLEFGNINLNNGKIGYLKSDKVNFAVDKEHSVLMIAEMKKMGGENTSSFWHKSLNELKPEDFISNGSAEEVIYEDIEFGLFTQSFSNLTPEIFKSVSIGNSSVKNLKVIYPARGENLKIDELQTKGLQNGLLDKLLVKGLDVSSSLAETDDNVHFNIKSLEVNKIGFNSFIDLGIEIGKMQEPKENSTDEETQQFLFKFAGSFLDAAKNFSLGSFDLEQLSITSDKSDNAFKLAEYSFENNEGEAEDKVTLKGFVIAGVDPDQNKKIKVNLESFWMKGIYFSEFLKQLEEIYEFKKNNPDSELTSSFSSTGGFFNDSSAQLKGFTFALEDIFALSMKELNASQKSKGKVVEFISNLENFRVQLDDITDPQIQAFQQALGTNTLDISLQSKGQHDFIKNRFEQTMKISAEKLLSVMVSLDLHNLKLKEGMTSEQMLETFTEMVPAKVKIELVEDKLINMLVQDFADQNNGTPQQVAQMVKQISFQNFVPFVGQEMALKFASQLENFVIKPEKLTLEITSPSNVNVESFVLMGPQVLKNGVSLNLSSQN